MAKTCLSRKDFSLLLSIKLKIESRSDKNVIYCLYKLIYCSIVCEKGEFNLELF